MAEIDPFSLTFEALWGLVDGFPPFAADVAIGNRIYLDKQPRDPMKDPVRVADMPEVILYPSGGASNLHFDSSQSQIIRNYTWMISTGDMRVNYACFPVQWHVIQAMASWTTLIGGLTWRGQPFITDMNIPDTTTGQSDPDANRNIPGWSSLVTVAVEFTFITSILKTPEVP